MGNIMKKLFVVLALVCLVGNASAQHADGIGIYFDQEALTNCWGGLPWEPIRCYLIITNPSTQGAISGWECHVDYPADILVIDWEWEQYGGGTNFNVPPDFRVGLPVPLMPTEALVVARLDFLVPVTMCREFQVRASDFPSIVGSPAYVSFPANEFVPLYPTAGDAPNAGLDCPDCTAVLGTVVIDPDPDGLDAPWSLEGPGGPWSGSGDATLPDMITGFYTLTWSEDGDGAIPDPNPLYQTLPLSEEITFSGSYYDPPEWVVLKSPSIMAAAPGGTSPDVFGMVYIDVITDTPGESADIAAELGYGPDGSIPTIDPDWHWVPAVYNRDYGLNDEYVANTSAASLGLYDYCYRFSYKGGDWVYGDLNSSDDGYSANWAGSFMVVAEPGWANLQGPPTTLAGSGGPSPNIYGQVWLLGLTSLAGQGSGIIAELGYGTDGSDPSTDPSWQWTTAAYNMDVAANDEYVATITASTPGIYDYCFRFALNGGAWIYGDLDGSGNGYSADQAGALEVIPGAEVGDWVWLDLNNDGTQDPGEPGYGGIIVQLFDSDDNEIAWMFSEADGHYSFSGLLPGDYYLTFLGVSEDHVSPADIGDDEYDSDVVWETGKTAVFSLASGQIDHSWDCGFKAYADGVEDGEIPTNSALFSNVPNPFNPSTTIAFDLPRAEVVRLTVFDISGRLIRSLVNGSTYVAGRHQVEWNGRDEAGQRAASGVYFYRIEAGDYSTILLVSL